LIAEEAVLDSDIYVVSTSIDRALCMSAERTYV